MYQPKKRDLISEFIDEEISDVQNPVIYSASEIQNILKSFSDSKEEINITELIALIE